jgi:acyl-coenzyme A thioesterase PaaI-like protein
VLRPFPSYPACPVCGDRTVNPGALEVRWSWDDLRRRAVGRFVPGPEHTGYAGVLHGGLLTALLDECLAWACAVAKGAYCMTGDLQVRFRTPARLRETLEITSWTVETWGPYVRAEGEVLGPSGVVVASATATFAALSREESQTLQAALRLAPGDVDVLTEDLRSAAPLPETPQEP